jgi:hypothetical protein
VNMAVSSVVSTQTAALVLPPSPSPRSILRRNPSFG